MLKIRRPLGRLIFNMGIAIPGKTVFLIETAPRPLYSVEDVINIKSIVPDIFYALHGAVQLTHFFGDDCENMCALSCYHQIASANY